MEDVRGAGGGGEGPFQTDDGQAQDIKAQEPGLLVMRPCRSI